MCNYDEEDGGFLTIFGDLLVLCNNDEDDCDFPTRTTCRQLWRTRVRTRRGTGGRKKMVINFMCWLTQSWSMSRQARNFFPSGVMFLENNSNSMYFVCNLCSFCVISFTDDVNLSTYCDNLRTYCVKFFCTNVEKTVKCEKQDFLIGLIPFLTI